VKFMNIYICSNKNNFGSTRVYNFSVKIKLDLYIPFRKIKHLRRDSMPKDSQPDNKVARELKANFQTPITDEEGKNKNRTRKKLSVPREGFRSDHIGN